MTARILTTNPDGSYKEPPVRKKRGMLGEMLKKLKEEKEAEKCATEAN